ncbi:MAG: transposase [Candidatus Latescibacterota bacterium]
MPGFPERHGVPLVVARAFRAVLECRTAVLGGHVVKCEDGHVISAHYNACRNRSCPRCAFYRTARWLKRQAGTLLGCPHHHIIFTIPHQLNELWLCNYRVLSELLFASARAALFTLAADPRYLGATPGAIMALHTWGQQLLLHPHLHVLVTAGGVCGAGSWLASRRRWFLPAEPLKQLFRGAFLSGLKELAERGKLRLPDGRTAAEIRALCRQLWDTRWNVEVRERYQDPTAVLNYLGRYLNGGPIGEGRLLGLEGDRVSFRYKDYRTQDAKGVPEKVLELDCDEFVRRVLLHVPPQGFHLVRGYGLYRRGGNTEQVRRFLRDTLPITPELHQALAASFTDTAPEPEYPSHCPICGKPVHLTWYPRRAGPFAVAA